MVGLGVAYDDYGVRHWEEFQFGFAMVWLGDVVLTCYAGSNK